MARSIAAVFAGLFLIVSLSFAADVAVPILIPWAFAGSQVGGTVGLLVLTLAYVALATAAGGYLTAHLASSRPATHAAALGVLGLALVAVGTAFTWTSAPVWYQVLSLVFVMPFALAGGYLRMRRRRGRG